MYQYNNVSIQHMPSQHFFFLISEDSRESRVLNERQAINFITLLFGKFKFLCFLFVCLFFVFFG